MISNKLQNFYDSLASHQIKGHGISWFSMVVTLTAGENQYLEFPVRGVIRVCEQKTHLGFGRTCVFHELLEDGRLGPPVTVGKPVFTFDGGSIE